MSSGWKFCTKINNFVLQCLYLPVIFLESYPPDYIRVCNSCTSFVYLFCLCTLVTPLDLHCPACVLSDAWSCSSSYAVRRLTGIWFLLCGLSIPKECYRPSKRKSRNVERIRGNVCICWLACSYSSRILSSPAWSILTASSFMNVNLLY
jgi:hypothetical protein